LSGDDELAALHHDGQFEKAAEVGQGLLDEQPDDLDPSTVVLTAEAYENSDRITTALRLLDGAIDANPEVEVFAATRAAMVERLAITAESTAPPMPPRPTTGSESSATAAALESSVTMSDERDAVDSADDGSTAKISWVAILAGLLAGAGLALVVLAIL